MKKWSEKVARQWLYNCAMDLIHGDLYTEGGQLISYSKFYEKKITKSKFISILQEVLWYEQEEIDDCLDEVRKLNMAAFI